MTFCYRVSQLLAPQDKKSYKMPQDNVFVMVNFMSQLDWAIEYLDSWSNITLDVSLRVFLDGFNI